jgi:hypothetical protein
MEMIEEDYCSFEIAKLLKEKGFNCPCLRVYDKNGIICIRYAGFDIPHNYTNSPLYLCPTHQMTMAWLREKGIYVCPKLCCFCGSKKKDIPYYLWEPRIIRLPSNNIIYPQPLDMCKHYENYEEAVEASLKHCLEYLI